MKDTLKWFSVVSGILGVLTIFLSITIFMMTREYSPINLESGIDGDIHITT